MTSMSALPRFDPYLYMHCCTCRSLAVICNLDQMHNLKEPEKKPPKQKKKSPAKGQANAEKRRTRGSGAHEETDAVASKDDWEADRSSSAPASVEAVDLEFEPDGFASKGTHIRFEQKEEEETPYSDLVEIQDSMDHPRNAEGSTQQSGGDSEQMEVDMTGEGEEEEPSQEDKKLPAPFGGQPCIVFMDSLSAHRSDKIHLTLVK